jgi:hypothetical protein
LFCLSFLIKGLGLCNIHLSFYTINVNMSNTFRLTRCCQSKSAILDELSPPLHHSFTSLDFNKPGTSAILVIDSQSISVCRFYNFFQFCLQYTPKFQTKYTPTHKSSNVQSTFSLKCFQLLKINVLSSNMI